MKLRRQVCIGPKCRTSPPNSIAYLGGKMGRATGPVCARFSTFRFASARRTRKLAGGCITLLPQFHP